MPIKRVNEFPDGSGSLTSDDIFLFMDDPSGESVTKKISLSQISAAIGGGFVSSDTTGIPGASGVNNIVIISQDDYTAIGEGNYDPNTVYFVP